MRARRGEGQPRATIGDARCKVCANTFRFTVVEDAPPPPICGQLPCRARHTWTAADWAGRARMAETRHRAGVELDDLDREALRRARQAAA